MSSPELPNPSSAPARPQAVGWFNRAVTVACVPARWQPWQLAALHLALVALTAWCWWLATATYDWLAVTLVLLLFTAVDLIVLASLPRLQISFGPLRPQFGVLQAPRLLSLLLAAGLAAWIGPKPALALAVTLNIGASLALVWGALEEPLRVGLTQLHFASPKVPADQAIRLLHLSDLHVERWGEREERVLARVRQAAPDLILLSGDYVGLSYTTDPDALAAARRLLSQLKAPLGVFAVLGTPVVDQAMAPIFAQVKARLLRDEAATVRLPGGHLISVLGIECHHEPVRDGATLSRVVAGAPANSYRILLYHSPELMDQLPAAEIDLYLCGHTHGGQVRLPGYGALYTASHTGKRYEMGHYQKGGTHLYVSRGIGLEGLSVPRVRFLCPPEVTLIELGGPLPAAG